jgi:hypothetical protein
MFEEDGEGDLDNPDIPFGYTGFDPLARTDQS